MHQQKTAFSPLFTSFNWKDSFNNWIISFLCIRIIVLIQKEEKTMKHLTRKEEEIMNLFWEHGSMFVKEMVELYDDPKPHVNTVSTYVRMLEERGYVGHRSFGGSHQYFPAVSREEFHKRTVRNVISKYFNNSYMGLVSSLVKEEEISLDELKDLIRQVEEAPSNSPKGEEA